MEEISYKIHAKIGYSILKFNAAKYETADGI
jgi:hypothetical protein